MAQNKPLAGPPGDLIIMRTDGVRVDNLPNHRPAVEFTREVLAHAPELRDAFERMHRASQRIAELEEKLKHFPVRSYTNTPKEQRDFEDEAATQRAARETAALTLVMILDGLLERYEKLANADTRTVGDCGAKGIRFTEINKALGNRQRHLGSWKNESPANLSKNPSVQVIRALGVDELSSEATYEALRVCDFQSYDDFEKRVLSISNAALEGSGLKVEVSPSGYRINVPVRPGS